MKARWMAWTVAALVFVAILSQSVGGLAPITDTLDAIGFNVGKRRFSLLSALTILLTIVVLMAIVRVAKNRHGPTGDVEMKFIRNQLRFESVSRMYV